jgi:cell division protein FtsL
MGKPILTQHRLAFVLYFVLIAIHVVLVIVWSKHYERRFVINDDSETLARLQQQAITVLIPQLFAIVSSFFPSFSSPADH